VQNLRDSLRRGTAWRTERPRPLVDPPLALAFGVLLVTGLLGVACRVITARHLVLTFKGPVLVILAVGAWLIAAWHLLGWRGHIRAPREGQVVALVVTVLIIQGTFTVVNPWKLAIVDRGFTWDARLAALDALLHGGRDPWRFLAGLPGIATVGLDRLYAVGWAALVIGGGVAIALGASPARRARFLLAFVLTFVLLGVGVAHVFASAGPCYYAQVTGEPRFLPQVAALQRVHERYLLFAVEGHHWLWAASMSGGATPYTGISAMPSMHVAVPVLYTAMLWDRRAWALPLLALTILTMVASVHLGWHYAVDGYASALAVPAIWWVSGKVR
jgi:hypothetical protein